MRTKNTTLLILASLAFFVPSCKKGNENNRAIIGKWQGFKLRTYQLDTSGFILYDTTYTAPFTAADYVQFNVDGTCSLATDHYYYINAPGYSKTPQKINPVVSMLKYTAIGNKFKISPQSMLRDPGGFISADTVLLINNNTLMYHSVFYGHGGNAKSISNSYYTR